MFLRAVAASSLVVALAIATVGCAPETTAGESVVNVPADAPTLAAALEAVSPGGMILLSPGVYLEQLVIDKVDVTIRGLDRNSTIVDGELKRPFGIVGIADGVRIENLTVRNTTFYGVLVTGLHDENGPSAHNSEGYTRLDPEKFPPLERFSINHVTASNNGLYGIYAFNAQHGTITDSYASGSADSGFYVGQCPDCDILVSGNVAENNAVGFENANASKSLTIVGNRFSNNRVGITLISNYQEAFTPESATLVMGNVVSGNTSAESPAQESGGFGIGIGISGGRDNVIVNNLIEANPRAGILLENTEDLAATGNAFDGNSFVTNGIDVADVSASRTPPSHNCFSGASTPTALPADYFSDCSEDTQPSVRASDLPGPAAPRGISFAKVPLPIDQPNMSNITVSPEPLPATVTRPTAGSVPVPSADLLIERTRR
jgi:nitrous oxidase accessory protein NosD